MSKYANAYKEDLEKEDPQVQQQAVQQEVEPDDPEEASFKKRYGDLRRHMQNAMAQKDDELKKVKSQLEDATRKQIRFPKTETEIADWAQRYPDVAAIIDTIAQKRALEALNIGEKKMARLQDLERKITREKAEAELMKLHPDFGDIRSQKEFHDWVAMQPKWVQSALYENDSDALAASRAIDLYKADTKRKPGRPSKDAAQAVTRSTNTAPVGAPKGKFTESQVSKMSAREYEANEVAIMESIKSGQFVYDLTGAAR
jgi:hypothetical protein